MSLSVHHQTALDLLARVDVMPLAPALLFDAATVHAMLAIAEALDEMNTRARPNKETHQ